MPTTACRQEWMGDVSLPDIMAYLDVKELKEILNVDGSTHLNIFFANSSDEDLAGVATWPWDKEALTHLGGIVLNPSFYGTFGHTHTMIHEIGHSLGLYHVFRGVSEIESCNDACMETEPSLETGDLCADTNPTPKYKHCRDPEPGNETCGHQNFVHTPFNNYMSYADDDCTDSFSLNQVARMHCYLDLIYQTWQPHFRPPPVPLAPQVVAQNRDSITLEWFPPISGHFYDREVGSVCDKCAEGRVLLQYACNSSSPRPCSPSGHWSPREAEGPPDVEQACEPSVRTWSPHNGMDLGMVPPPCPLQGCMLQLEFTYAVVPDSLTVWVTFSSPEETVLPAIHNIILLTVAGNNLSLGPSDLFCDTPLTIKLAVQEKVYGVQFFTMEQHLEIDATLLTSKPDCEMCRACEPLHYRLFRQPPFTHAPQGVRLVDSARRYVDRVVEYGGVYTYQIQTISSGSESEPSPPLTHRLGAPYCGDGLIQRSHGEDCDDMNSINGDGCSSHCKKEPFFNCIDVNDVTMPFLSQTHAFTDEPSMCYYYDGDGVCEDFERETSVKDCGLYTPNGFLDQWATTVEVSHEERLYCPADVAAGYPAVTKVTASPAAARCTVSICVVRDHDMRGRLKDGSLKNLSALVSSEDNIAGEDSKDVCDLHTDLSVKRLCLRARRKPSKSPEKTSLADSDLVFRRMKRFGGDGASDRAVQSELPVGPEPRLQAICREERVGLQTCQSKVFDLSDGVSQYAWFPCREAQGITWYPQYWLKAYFSHPMVAAAVIIHLAADGTSYIDQTQCNITVQLIDTKEAVHSLGDWRLSCRSNPLVIPVNHDLSVAFYHTKAILLMFRSDLVAISGIGLRTFQFFDPITISGCQSDEIYNPMGQSCVHYSCEAIDCQEPLIRNAEVKCSDGEYFNGARCTVTCNCGYVLQIHRDDDIIKSQTDSTVTITCADRKWNKQVSCEPVDCGLPDKYHVHPAHFDFPEGTTYGKKSTFQCKEPAQLVGTNNSLTCMEDGLWSFPEALCELRCPVPPPVPNAMLQTKRCNDTGLKVGTLCKYKCRPGYHVANKPKRRAFKRQCTEDGRWLEGSCEPITCPSPPSVFHGMYQCTDGFRFDSTCWIHCDRANRTLTHPPACKQGLTSNVIRCRKDGNWTGSFRLCPQLKGQCSLPQNLHPSIRISCRRGYGIGEECELSCRDSYNDAVILLSNMTASTILDHHWMNPPKVKHIVCTMGLKWYPHPEDLHCIKGCEPFMGDNYCDAINNRAYCNYDGGDCCHSTVKTKKKEIVKCDVCEVEFVRLKTAERRRLQTDQSSSHLLHRHSGKHLADVQSATLQMVTIHFTLSARALCLRISQCSMFSDRFVYEGVVDDWLAIVPLGDFEGVSGTASQSDTRIQKRGVTGRDVHALSESFHVRWTGLYPTLTFPDALGPPPMSPRCGSWPGHPRGQGQRKPRQIYHPLSHCHGHIENFRSVSSPSPCPVISGKTALVGTPTPWRTGERITCTRWVETSRRHILLLLLHRCTSYIIALHHFQTPIYLLLTHPDPREGPKKHTMPSAHVNEMLGSDAKTLCCSEQLNVSRGVGPVGLTLEKMLCKSGHKTGFVVVLMAALKIVCRRFE
ncbi:Pappalysin-1 [Triplophysa tibetana]|uniref:Pappalysin-1 n=1 Tax=Triplophysa tibetana TaxID=1572043 RepID=A0A5A9P158_9TELE|nr:Pappalysin-1 [Triplophysa tibetana]